MSRKISSKYYSKEKQNHKRKKKKKDTSLNTKIYKLNGRHSVIVNLSLMNNYEVLVSHFYFPTSFNEYYAQVRMLSARLRPDMTGDSDI